MITPPAFEMDPLSLAKSMAVQLSDFCSDVSGRAARLARGAKGVDDALGGERADSANVDRRRRRLRALGAKLELPRRNDEAVVLLLGEIDPEAEAAKDETFLNFTFEEESFLDSVREERFSQSGRK